MNFFSNLSLLSEFLLGTTERRLLGRRCSQCEKVYLMPRGVCSMCGAAFTDEDVELGPNGTVATFLVVNVPFASQEVEIPYTAVEVLFDGAHTTAQFLMRGMPTHFDRAPGDTVTIRSYVHLFSDHVRAAHASGLALVDMDIG